MQVRTCWINRCERLTAIVLDESICLCDDLHDREILWVMAFPLCMVDSWRLSGNRAVSHKGPNKLWCQVILPSTLSLFLLWCGRFRKCPIEGCLNDHILASIPLWWYLSGSASKLSLGCETWTAVLAVLNQWWVTMYGYWSASISINLQEDNC